MALKLRPIIQEVSKDEQSVLDLENRRLMAESSIELSSVAKKKIDDEVEIKKVELQDLQKQILKKVNEVEKYNLLISETEISFNNHKKSFEDFIKESVSEELKIVAEIKQKEAERDSVSLVISDFSKKHELDKYAKNEEIKQLEDSKNLIIDEIEKLKVEEKEISQSIKIALEKLNISEEGIKKLELKKQELETIIFSNRSIMEDQKNFIENNKIFINDGNKEKETKQQEILVLDTDIKGKKEEVKALEGKVFTISNREIVLNQKEAFIKNQFERAGIVWQQ